MARINASSQSGSINLLKVYVEVNANTIGGKISVRESTGSIKLHTVGGTVEARNLNEASTADVFETSTISGDVTLEQIRYKHLRVNTISGEVDYAGPLSRGARHSFQSISGRLRLSLPPDSSFRVSGTLGGGVALTSGFSLKDNAADASVSRTGAMRRLDAIVGSGDASITLSFFSGSIQITKQ